MIDYHYFFLIGSVLVAAVSQVLLKKVPCIIMTAGSGIFESVGDHGLYFDVRLRVFKYYGTSGRWIFSTPVIDSLGYVLVPVCGAEFFHEKLTARKLVGICCIVLGMAVFYL